MSVVKSEGGVVMIEVTSDVRSYRECPCV